MAIVEVDKDAMEEIFDIKENVKKSIYAVMSNRLTAAHLASDVYVLLEKLDNLELELFGGTSIPSSSPSEQAPAQEQPQVSAPAEQSQEPVPAEQPQESAPAEQSQEPAPAEQPQPEQSQSQGQ